MSGSASRWILSGQSVFGLLIGLLAGLSLTPVVGTLLGLAFAFIGGSVTILLKGKDAADLVLIGKSIFFLSLFLIFGMSLGIALRIGLIPVQDPAPVQGPAFVMADPISLNQVKTLSKKKDYADLICAILQKGHWSPRSLTVKELSDMIDDKVPAKVLHAMLGFEADCAKPVLHAPGSSTPETGPSLHTESNGQNSEDYNPFRAPIIGR